MFKDEKQRSRACRALLCTLPKFRQDLATYWTDRPTEITLECLFAGGGALSHGEAVLLRCTMDFWNGEGGARFSEMLAVLDDERIEAVSMLAVALSQGGEALEIWIEWLEAVFK